MKVEGITSNMRSAGSGCIKQSTFLSQMRDGRYLVGDGSVTVCLADARRLQMLIQVGFKGKRFMTSRTLKIFIRRVRLHMSSQIRSISKCFPAVRASVWFLTSV